MQRRYTFAKRHLALVIAAHNEELVIGDTIGSAIAAGQPACDIYVVSDGSTDATVTLATALLGRANVLDQLQGGKADAIMNAIAHFGIIERYRWMHIADADGVFDSQYFGIMQAKLNPDWAAATGYISSLKGGWISKYRSYEYTVGLEIQRRVQAKMGVISVIPGPTSVFNTRILSQLDFQGGTMTEDMDVTFQIHRLGLGKIAFIPSARTYTQDPKDLHDYIKQISRWYRGTFQVMARHRIGTKANKFDAYLSFVVLEQALLILQLIAFPLWAWWTTNYGPLALLFLSDLVTFIGFTLFVAGKNRRADVLGAFPLFYFLRLVNLYVFSKSWFEIVVQRKFRTASAGWSTAGRRYRITAAAVSGAK